MILACMEREMVMHSVAELDDNIWRAKQNYK